MSLIVHLSEKKGLKLFSRYRNQKVFLVHGKNSYLSCGAKNIFDKVFTNLNCNVFEHFDFSENPKWDEIKIGIEKFNLFNPDVIVAIGGGSVIDTAKLIRFFSNTEGNPQKYIEPKNDLIPFFVLPTTSGTGSETTHFAVCYVDGKKYSVASKQILPSKVFLDYRFTLNNPKYLTACTGLDALCQAIESYWSVKSTKESRKYAIKAIKNIYPNLINCVNNPNKKIRRNVSIGSYYAGKAINISFTTAPHAYSYGITSKFGIPHGHAVAISLPYFFELNSNVNEENCNDIRGTDFVKERLFKLTKLLKIKINAKEELTNYINLILQKEDIQIWFEKNWNTISDTVNVQRLGNNPVKVI